MLFYTLSVSLMLERLKRLKSFWQSWHFFLIFLTGNLFAGKSQWVPTAGGCRRQSYLQMRIDHWSWSMIRENEKISLNLFLRNLPRRVWWERWKREPGRASRQDPEQMQEKIFLLLDLCLLIVDSPFGSQFSFHLHVELLQPEKMVFETLTSSHFSGRSF